MFTGHLSSCHHLSPPPSVPSPHEETLARPAFPKSLLRMRKLTRLALVLVLSFAAFGCASRPKIDPNIDWSERIGNYTWDQAMAELGRPAVVAESSEGRSADWIIKRSPNVSFGFGVGGGSYGSGIGTGVGVGTSVSPPPRGEYLHLSFDPQGKLRSWSKVKH